MNFIRVLSPGLQSSIQDHGRYGYGNIGVSESGVLDELCYNTLNHLLGNAYGTNALEITFGGAKFEVNGYTSIAFTGAKVPIFINGKQVSLWQSHYIRNGDIIDIGYTEEGLRVYLGISGGFITNKILDSYSVSVKEGLGSSLKNEDKLLFVNTPFLETRKLQQKYIPTFPKELILRVILGYQHEDFDKKDMEFFFNTSYQVTSKSNRMAYRLSGYKFKKTPPGIISEAISYGAVQIPPHGEPIILLKERQTIGGYPKIGSILPLDCFKLAQYQANTIIRFQAISLQEATFLMKKFYNDFL